VSGPNPLSTGIYHVVTDQRDKITQVEVLNLLGQNIGNWSYNIIFKGVDVDFSNLPNAVYLLRIHFGSAILSKKIILSQ
jgi:hypothetical protein